VEFDYRLVGTGWAEGWLAIGDEHVCLTASYLSDALGDLLAAVLLLLEDGAAPVEVSWDEEPGEYRFVFVPEGDGTSAVTVLWFDELRSGRPNSDGRPILAATCKVADLAATVASGARAVLEEWGTTGYRRKWVDHDFPLPQLEQIEQTLSR